MAIISTKSVMLLSVLQLFSLTGASPINNDAQYIFDGKKTCSITDSNTIVDCSYISQSPGGSNLLHYTVHIKPSDGLNLTCDDIKWQMAQTAMGNSEGVCGAAGAISKGDDKAYMRLAVDNCEYSSDIGLTWNLAFYDWDTEDNNAACVEAGIQGAVCGIGLNRFTKKSCYAKDSAQKVKSRDALKFKWNETPYTEGDYTCTGPPNC